MSVFVIVNRAVEMCDGILQRKSSSREHLATSKNHKHDITTHTA